MNYKEYLEGLAYFDGYVITDEINYQYNGEGNALIIKYLSGTNYRDSKIQPIQIAIYTNDLVSTKQTLDSFTSALNNSPFYDNTDYIQQIYTTPLLLTPFDPTGNNYTHQFIISATLLISTNVSEIKKVFIDGVEYETTQRTLSYVAQVDNQRVSNSYLNTTNVTYGSLQFSCQMINKNNTLSNKIRLLRTNQLNIDTSFTIKLVYSDNDYEEVYGMKLDNVTINSENQSLPIISLSFIK
jgi:hypothetical protein